jgi:hypothetical protein
MPTGIPQKAHLRTGQMGLRKRIGDGTGAITPTPCYMLSISVKGDDNLIRDG